MKKFLLLIVMLMCTPARAAVTTPPDTGAQCLPATITTVACGAGYYFSNQLCVRCPEIGKNAAGQIVYGATYDPNKDGIESCFAPSGDYMDDTGQFTFINKCDYSLN